MLFQAVSFNLKRHLRRHHADLYEKVEKDDEEKKGVERKPKPQNYKRKSKKSSITSKCETPLAKSKFPTDFHSS